MMEHRQRYGYMVYMFIIGLAIQQCSAADKNMNQRCDDKDNCPTNAVCLRKCQCREGYDASTNNKNCININECDSIPCQNGGSCKDGINMYTCHCVAGYTGTTCDNKNRLDKPCDDTTPCSTNAQCSNGICKCRSGYSDVEGECRQRSNTAAAVSIPLVILALVVVVVVVIYIRRKRRLDKKNNERITNGTDTDNARKQTTVSVSNRAYVGRLDDETIGNKQQQSGSRNSDYTEIADVDQNNPEYHTISFKPEEFPVGAGYAHLPKQKHNTDNTYAHTTRNQTALQNDTAYSHIGNPGEIKNGTDTTSVKDDSDPPYSTLQPIDRRGVQQNAVEDNDEYNHIHFPSSTTTTEVADKNFSEGYVSLGTRTATSYEVVEEQGVANTQLKNSTSSALSEDNPISKYEGNGTDATGVQSADDSGHNYFVLQKNDQNIEGKNDTGQNNYFVLEKSN